MITILPARLRIINFPRSHLIHVTHAIVKQLLFKDTNKEEYFFSFTENAYGISILADENCIENDFLPALETSHCPDTNAYEGIFRVLQVDDEGGQEFSGKRISDISEPLAEGRFSILYISTYQTDFVLVGEPKLHQAIDTLRRNGFEVDCDFEIDCDYEISNFKKFSIGAEEEEEEQDVFTLSTSSSRSSLPVDPTQFVLNTNVLVNHLQCVGLNRHYKSDWIHTVLKTLCYSELTSQNHHHSYESNTIRFCSFVATSQDISLIADTHIVDTFEEKYVMKELDAAALRVIQVHFSGSNIERCGIVRHISKPLSIDEHVNLLYLSTFMTANIIVSNNDLKRAVNILSDCNKSDVAVQP